MVSIMNSSFNLQKLLRDVFHPQVGEKGLVMVDLPTTQEQDNADWQERRVMAVEWRNALADAGVDIPALVTLTSTGSNNAELPERAKCGDQEISLSETLAESNLVIAMMQYSATAPLAHFVHDNPALRVASMPGVLRCMEETALAADYAEVARRVAVLEQLADRATLATLTFATGHEVQFDLRFRRAHGDAGQCRAHTSSRIINLPSGEAFIVPYEGERENEPSLTRGEIPVRENDEDLVYIIENNRIIDVTGTSSTASNRRSWFAADSARANVAELGLGCNKAAVVRGSVLEDEKAGIHWAFGRSEHLGGVIGPNAFRAPENVVHLDIVYAPGCPIEADTLTLTFADGSRQAILENNHWTVFE